MLTTDQINDLHHLYWAERWPIRKIEQHLQHELAHHQEVFGDAGADAGEAIPYQ